MKAFHEERVWELGSGRDGSCFISAGTPPMLSCPRSDNRALIQVCWRSGLGCFCSPGRYSLTVISDILTPVSFMSSVAWSEGSTVPDTDWRTILNHVVTHVSFWNNAAVYFFLWKIPTGQNQFLFLWKELCVWPTVLLFPPLLVEAALLRYNLSYELHLRVKWYLPIGRCVSRCKIPPFT